ncbi:MULTISPECIES: TRAP transporter large permease [unclassified Halomonas]|uniref:TRAP transporter large permease n=1 Tax=unclassified Halomonas TaxID=2609666 RepID=UPI00209F3B9B|nr:MULTISPECIES: TRAP transporter large permease [unclassified Halomonas]MCP1313887.1 TRAP transporter large permease [Halomonas sp. 707D7]MCP1326535.1 TRAP transporter large permease [Halomonas sp. 707D4]
MNPLLTLIGSFLLLIALSVPIAFAIGLASIVTILQLGLPLTSVVNQMFASINSFPLLAVPFFLLLGRLMNDGGITDRLLRFADSTVGHIRGGLGHINVMVSMMFASLSGSAAADTASVGAVLIPAMKKSGYPAPFAVALTAASSVLGGIIPPSILMVIYGAFGNVSVGALFMGGVLPGILVGVMQMGYVYYVAKRHGIKATGTFSFGQMGRTALIATPPMLLPIIILGGITLGVFTATEAASVAVLIGAVLAFIVYRAIPLTKLPSILSDSVVAFSLPMFAVASAGIMGWLISYLGIAQEVANFILSVTDSRIGIMLLVMGFMLVIGTVLSPVTAVIIFLPIIQGLCLAADINQVHMALVVILSLTLGLITPPYGICLLIATQIGEVSMPRAFLAVLPLIGLILLVIIALILLPSVFLFLPQMMFPKAF